MWFIGVEVEQETSAPYPASRGFSRPGETTARRVSRSLREIIRIHLRETATNSATIHSLARKNEPLRINQIQ